MSESIMFATSNEMADKHKTCEYCDRLVSSPNFAYHFCSGRKVFKGTKSAQQNMHWTAGIVRRFKQFSAVKFILSLWHSIASRQ